MPARLRMGARRESGPPAGWARRRRMPRRTPSRRRGPGPARSHLRRGALVDRQRQGMAARLAGHRVTAADPDRLRAMRAEDQQGAAGQFTAEVQEKGGRRVVNPMKIVEEPAQRSLGHDRSQSAEELVEEDACDKSPWRQGSLGRGTCAGPRDRPGNISRPRAAREAAGTSVPARSGPYSSRHRQGQARGRAQPPPCRPARCRPTTVKVAEERLGKPAQGGEGVLAAAGRAARASHKQVGVSGRAEAAKPPAAWSSRCPGLR